MINKKQIMYNNSLNNSKMDDTDIKNQYILLILSLIDQFLNETTNNQSFKTNF